MDLTKRNISRFFIWWKSQSTKRKAVTLSLLAVLIIFLISIGSQGDAGVVEAVRKQDLRRTISASGSVVSSTDLSLGFEQSKMVSLVRVYVGQKVKRGDILATLSNGTERASVTSAKGALLAARARYNKVIEGSSTEEIKLAQIQLDNAKKTQTSLVASARRKLFSSDLIADPISSTTDTAPTISGNYNGTEEGEYRISFTGQGTSDIRYNGLEKGEADVDDLPKPLGTRGLLIAFTGSAYSRDSSWKILIPNKSGSSYTTNYNAYIDALANAEAVIAEKEAQLELKKASARQPDVDAALAEMITAQAALDNANASYEKTILRAPADGTITSINVKVGEIPQLGKIAIELKDVSNLYLEANVNESNIKSVLVGQDVTVTFDAFPGEEFYATVSSIDPAATIENNVVNYKIKALITNTENIKPGMTANMTVLTAQIKETLVIPGRVIETRDDKKIVNLVIDEQKNKTEEREIVIGLTGDGDMVEILNGLSLGDKVLWNPAE